MPSVQQLCRYAIARSLFKATSLPRAVARLGFVQADPMRAPARAQDLILAQRVKGYRAGDLERRYPRLAIEETYFFNYGFLPRETLALLYPREPPRSWDASMRTRAQEVLAFVRQHGRTWPKDVQAHFDHGRIRRWGGDLNVSTHLLEGLHYRGLLRVARRDGGARVYEANEHAPPDDSPEARLARAGQLLDMVVRLYAPLPAASFGYLFGLLSRYGAPHLAAEIRQIREHATSRYGHAQVDGQLWLWPHGENPCRRWSPSSRRSSATRLASTACCPASWLPSPSGTARPGAAASTGLPQPPPPPWPSAGPTPRHPPRRPPTTCTTTRCCTPRT
jgi:hypothetical protein